MSISYLKGCVYLLSIEYVYLPSKEYALANLSILPWLCRFSDLPVGYKKRKM